MNKKSVILFLLLFISLKCFTSDSLKCEIIYGSVLDAYHSDSMAFHINELEKIDLECACCDEAKIYAIYAYANQLRDENRKLEYKIELDKLDSLFHITQFSSAADETYFQLLLLMMRGLYYEGEDLFTLASSAYEDGLERIIEPNGSDIDLWYLYLDILIQSGRVEMQLSNFRNSIKIVEYIDALISEANRPTKKPSQDAVNNCLLAKNYAGLKETEKALSSYKICNDYSISVLESASTNYLKKYTYQHLTNIVSEYLVAVENEKYARAEELFSIYKKFSREGYLTNYYAEIYNCKYLYDKGNLALAIEKLQEVRGQLNHPHVIDEIRLLYFTIATEIYENEERKEKREMAMDSLLQISRRIEINSELWSHRLLRAKSVLLKYYLETNKDDKAKAMIISFINFLENKLSNSIIFDDHIHLNKEVYPLLESCLNYLYKTGSEEIELTFRIFECTKALKLYKESAISSLFTMEQGSELENNYITAKNELRQAKIEMKNHKLPGTQIYELERKLSDLENQLRKSRNGFDFPIGMSEIANELSNSQLLTLGFSGNAHYYFLNISKTEQSLERIKKSHLDPLIFEFRKGILKISTKDINSSGLLYDSLKRRIPFEKLTDLIISPDGNLSDIAFGALEVKDKSYLVSKMSISYVPSAHIFDVSHKKPLSHNTELGLFLPKEEDNKPLLRYANKEVSGIRDLIEANVYSEENSTKEAFINYAPQKKLIHIASHAQFNMDSGDESYISLTATDSSTGRLYFNDIKSLLLDAELVSLSACETNLGKNYVGEGVQSLSRNFIAAGAKSVVSTMWAVNDQSTSEIMISFYKHLKNGEAKSVALQKAKLDFLENNPGEGQHPYYWAGLVLTGNDAPLFKRKSSFPYILAGGLLLFALAFSQRKRIMKLAS